MVKCFTVEPPKREHFGNGTFCPLFGGCPLLGRCLIFALYPPLELLNILCDMVVHYIHELGEDLLEDVVHT